MPSVLRLCSLHLEVDGARATARAGDSNVPGERSQIACPLPHRARASSPVTSGLPCCTPRPCSMETGLTPAAEMVNGRMAMGRHSSSPRLDASRARSPASRPRSGRAARHRNLRFLACLAAWCARGLGVRLSLLSGRTAHAFGALQSSLLYVWILSVCCQTRRDTHARVYLVSLSIPIR